MTHEELEEIRKRNAGRNGTPHGDVCGTERCFALDVDALLAEINRLRVERASQPYRQPLTYAAWRRLYGHRYPGAEPPSRPR